MKKLLILSALATFGLAVVSAQVATIQTTPPDNNQQLSINTQGVNGGNGQTASVSQTLNVIVPKATALHLTVGDLTFNLGDLGSSHSHWVCVSGPAANASKYGTLNPATGDYQSQLGSNFWNQVQTLPMGTYYSYVPGSWTTTAGPELNIYGAGVVNQYPPAQLANGQLVAGSKEYFVCYRDFILQTFSNWSYYDLTVTRTNPSSGAYTEPVYIQGNTYCTLTQDQPTGLYALGGNDGISGEVHLIPQSAAVGPTGQYSESCGQPGLTSWLDEAVVVAVKIDGEHYGNNTTTLTYTLTSADAPFSSSTNQ